MTHQLRHRAIQAARRATQTATIVLVVALIFLGLYYNYRAAGAFDRLHDAATPGWRSAILARIDARVGNLHDPEGFLAANSGTLWSMRILGLEIADPLAFVEASAARRTLHVPLLLAILPPLVVAVLLGRVFCSWICPGYVVFELAGRVQTLVRRGRTAPRLTFAHENKYALLGVGLLLAAATGLPMFSLFYPPALLSRFAHAIIFGTGVVGTFGILAAMVAVELFVAPRWWCRTMCPGGALYALLGGRRALRVRLLPGRCTHCRLCEPACEEGLDPVTQSRGIECDNCGACVRRCPEAALAFTLRLPGPPKPLRKEAHA
jgi:ferredoxin-type protein NapH